MDWIKVADVSACMDGGGVCVKWGEEQIAVFQLGDNWYATQNRCPHQQQEVLSRGLLGDAKGEPKVACPLHKNSFSLQTGEHLGEGGWTLKTYKIKVEDGGVFLKLEPLQATEQRLERVS